MDPLFFILSGICRLSISSFVLFFSSRTFRPVIYKGPAPSHPRLFPLTSSLLQTLWIGSPCLLFSSYLLYLSLCFQLFLSVFSS